MFSGSFKETKIHKVPMQEISFAGLKAVVECIYTAKIDLTDDNFNDIVPAAHLLQINYIIHECQQWMIAKISETTCFDFLRLADKYNFEEVQSAIHKFIMHNFVNVRQSTEFKEISQAALCKFLSSDTLRTGLKEIEVFEAVKEWIMHHKITDKSVIIDIMKNVRFALMTLEEVLDLLEEALVAENAECLKMVKTAANYHSNVYTQPLYEGPLNRPRGRPGVMLIDSGVRMPGGYNVEGNKTDIYYLDLPSFEASNINGVLNEPLVFGSINALSVGHFVYFFGINCFGYQNVTRRYNMTNDIWLDLKGNPSSAKVDLAMARHGNHIFSIGGMDVFHFSGYDAEPEKISDEMFEYSCRRNQWHYVGRAPVRCMEHAAECIKDLVYITGGFLSTDEVSDKVFAYDVKADLWLTKKSMNHARCDHVMAALNDNLYVFGGRSDTNANGGWIRVPYIEKYDIETDQWTVVDNDFYSVCASAFVANEKIFITGGEGSREADPPHGKRIVVFDPQEPAPNHIEVHEEQLPVECENHACVFLTVPELIVN